MSGHALRSPFPVIFKLNKYRKMKKLLFTIAMFLGLFSETVSAQECASDVIEKSMITTYPSYANDRTSLEQFITNRTSNSTSRINSVDCQLTAATYTIPVVFHIMYTTAASNINDAQVADALAGLNQRWSYMGITFVLAKQDPYGNQTSGITRTDCNAVPNFATIGIDPSLHPTGTPDTIIKKMDMWPSKDYINIWIVAKSVNTTAYSNMPSNYKWQGLVIPYVMTTTINSAIPHEMGHYFGLMHTHQGSTTTNCAGNSNTEGDFCTDTPPMKQSDCGFLSCGRFADSLNSLNNIMSYCNERLFTPNQKQRVISALLSGLRWSLVSSKGLSSPDARNEVSLDSIAFTEDPTHPCNWKLNPMFKFENRANNTVESLQVTGVINGITITRTIHPNPGVLRGSSNMISFGEIPLIISGSYDMSFTIDKVNDTADAIPFNNIKCINFDVDLKQVSVLATAYPVIAGTVTGSDVLKCDGTVKLHQVPKAGNTFVGWFDKDGNNVSTESDLDVPVNIATSDSVIKYTAKYTVVTGVYNSSSQSIFKLYPNPATSVLNVDFGKNSDYDMQVINIIGEVIWSEHVSDKQAIVDVSAYPKGAYILKISDGEGSITSQRFLLQ